MTYSDFQNVEMKVLEIRFPGRKKLFVAQLVAEIWPFTKILGKFSENYFNVRHTVKNIKLKICKEA